MTNTGSSAEVGVVADENLNQFSSSKEDKPNLAIQSYLDAKAEGVPMCDLLESAVRFKAALTEMGRISSVGVGFLTAVNSESGGSIWARYREGTPTVTRNAANKLERREITVKKYFAQAIGYHALKNAQPRLVGRRRLDTWATHRWLRFSTKFTGPDNADRREEYRRQLSKQITQQKRIRRKNNLPIPESIDNIKV